MRSVWLFLGSRGRRNHIPAISKAHSQNSGGIPEDSLRNAQPRCIADAVLPSNAVTLLSCCCCANHHQRLCRRHCTVHCCLSPVLLCCRCRRSHRRCRCCCYCYCHHHHRPLLLIFLFVGCCVVVCHPLLSLHAVMRPSTLSLTASFAANCHPPLPRLLLLQLPLPPGLHHCHRYHPWLKSPSSIAKERGKSSTTIRVPMAASL